MLASRIAGGKRLSRLWYCQPRKRMAATMICLETLWVYMPTFTFPVFLSMPLPGDRDGKARQGLIPHGWQNGWPRACLRYEAGGRLYREPRAPTPSTCYIVLSDFTDKTQIQRLNF